MQVSVSQSAEGYLALKSQQLLLPHQHLQPASVSKYAYGITHSILVHQVGLLYLLHPLAKVQNSCMIGLHDAM